MKMKRIAAVIPVAQIPEDIQKPSDQEFQTGADAGTEEKDAGRVDFFSPAAQQQIEKHCADAVDRKPRPVEEAAVGKGFVPIQKDGNLPEKPADRAEKEEINLLGEEKRYRSLLRCAEFGKIRKTVMFFHGDSITGTLKIIEL